MQFTLKRKPKPELINVKPVPALVKAEIVIAPAPAHHDVHQDPISGWSYYKVHSGGISTPNGINRSYYPYEGRSTGKYMTDVFNAICTEEGVQCTVQMCPQTFRQMYIFTNFGDRLVKIEWNEEVRFIEPGESVTLYTDSSLKQHLPLIKALNNGTSHE